MNRCQGTNSARMCSLAGRYENSIPSRFLAPIDCIKIPALEPALFLSGFQHANKKISAFFLLVFGSLLTELLQVYLHQSSKITLYKIILVGTVASTVDQK